METTIEIELDEISSDFNSYEDLLKTFPEFKSYQREIKLNTILQENKIQFDIYDINTLFGHLSKGIESNINGVSRVRDTSFRVSGMSFILKNTNVEKLSITIDSVNFTEDGKNITNLIKEKSPLILKFKYIDGKIPYYGNFWLDTKIP